jgi:hypothetical protein
MSTAVDSAPRAQRRLALLIGVDHYDAGDFPSIPTIERDLERLEATLKEAGYSVRVLPSEQLTKGHIRGELVTFVSSPQTKGATVLVYLSGHGLHVGGEDYLIPRDAYSLAFVENDAKEALVNTDIRAAVTASPADAVLLFVDACREGLDSASKAVLTPDFGAHLAARAHPRLVTVNGCDPKGYCYYSEELGASVFAEGLIRAMGPGSDARTVREVLAATDTAVRDLVAQYHPGRSQRLNVSVSLDTSGDEVLDREITGAVPGRWRTAARNSGLWSRTPNEASDALRGAVDDVVAAAWERVQDAIAGLVDDPWRDPAFPERCLRWIDEALLPPDLRLEPVEVAALLVAPFLREVVLAEGVRRFAPADPLELRPVADADDVRAELEAAHQLFPRVTERGQRLSRRERLALGSWLMHRAVLRRIELWDPDVPEPVARDLAEQLAAEVAGTADTGELTDALRALAVHVAGSREDLARESDSDKPPLEERVRIFTPTGGEAVLRQEALATILALAGQLAVDVRQLRDVIPEHVGVREGLWPEDVVRVAEELIWARSGDGGALRPIVSCPHPAIHLALLDQVEHVRELLDHARRRCDVLQADLCAPLAHLPTRISTDRIRPAPHSYDLPLLTFRLAHDEIRDLLMGVRLYGDPALAIRELYQNALDACRYRRVRSQYAGRDYVGRIRFRQGAEDGRPFIECHDNGVGMGDHELEQLFSRGGRRFVNSPEFLWEQAKWRRKKLRMWPNSRFGIGVFSYFMLAEEIDIETARVDRVAVTPDEVLDVRISSSGSLFRISRRHDRSHEGGTRVRLYLRNPEQPVERERADDPARAPEAVSCLDSLQGFLRLSEFEVTCEVDGEERDVWPAGELHLPPHQGDALVEQVSPDVWFVDGEGCLLADGLMTDQSRFGYFVNLSRELQPILSVDRTRLESWNVDAVDQMLAGCAGGLAMGTGTFTYEWLWRFCESNGSTAQMVWESLAARGEKLEVTTKSEPPSPRPMGAPDSAAEYGVAVPVARLGVFPFDAQVVQSPSPTSERPAPWDSASRYDTPRFDVPDLALLWWMRRRLLEELKIVPSAAVRGTVPPPVDIGSQEPLDPIDDYLMRRPDSRYPYYGSHMYSLEGSVAARAVMATRRFERSMREIARRLRRLVVYGISITPTLRPDPPDILADERDVEIVDALAVDLAADGGHRRMVRLVGVANSRRERPETLIARAEALGFVIPDLRDHPLLDRVPSRADFQALDRLQTAWGPLAWVDVAFALPVVSGEPDRPRLLALLTHAAGLDDDAERMALAERCASDEKNFIALSRDVDGLRPWVEQLTRSHITAVAARLREPPEDVLTRIRAFAGLLDLDATEVVDDVADADEQDGDGTEKDPRYAGLSAMDATLVSQEFDGDPPWVVGEVPMIHLLGFAILQERPLRDVVARVEALGETVPVKSPPVPADFLDWMPTTADLEVIPDEDTKLIPLDEVPPPLHFVSTALETRETVGATARRFWYLAPLLWPALELPDWSFTELDDVRAEQQDLVLLRDGATSDGRAVTGRVEGMHILRAAVRLGQPMGVVFDRLSQFGALGVEMPSRADGPWRDRIPTWQDFVALSPSLDGAAGLSPGAVSQDHVAGAAVAIGETTDETAERLRAFAPLFGLQVP